MARDLHRLQEAGLRAVDDAAVQVLARRERDRVDDEIEPPQSARMRSNTACICPGWVTSSGRAIVASERASGSTYCLALSFR